MESTKHSSENSFVLSDLVYATLDPIVSSIEKVNSETSFGLPKVGMHITSKIMFWDATSLVSTAETNDLGNIGHNVPY